MICDTAVIVTRGDVDLIPIAKSLPFPNIVVWDNSRQDNLKVMGRYAALHDLTCHTVYTQDDDSICDNIPALLAAHQPGRITANMITSRWSAYTDSCLVGWGSVFDRCLPAVAFARWRAVYPNDEKRLLLDCDVVFTALTPHVKIDVGVTHLPYARNADRMWQMPDHLTRRAATLEMARAIRKKGTVKLNLGSGPNPIPGFVNLDRTAGWRFEDGLGMFLDGSVAAITISHALMYLPLELWPALFTDIGRVLRRGGIIRVTEDATDDPRSERFGGWDDAQTLTSAGLVIGHLRSAGLEPHLRAADESSDPTLIQRWHGDAPKVFHVEGTKP